MLSSAANTLRTLEYLAENGEVGVSEVGRYLGVTAGTAHRLISTLVETGFAEQNPSNRRYRPSTRLIIVAEQVRRRLSVREIVHRELTELARTVRETVNLAVLDDNKVLYIDKVLSDRPFGVDARIGSRLPVSRTALGKVLAAALSPSQQEDVLRAIRHETSDPDAPPPPSVSEFRKRLDLAQSLGYAEDLGEYLPDICCIATAIRGRDDRVVAAISITVPRSRFSRIESSLLEQIQLSAKAISHSLRGLGVDELRSTYGAFLHDPA
ncbi:MAG TPA: IclR family transcriptional regulator [Acidimicrobiales bacterium]|nr:IclR family transcriptional regulator [Acidimicrobiales bacterium]